MVADFTWPCRACSGVFRLWGSCRGLAVLGSCSSGMQHPPRAGAAIWVTENPRGSSLWQPTSEGLSENVGRSFHSLAKLVVVFWAAGCPAESWQSFAAIPQECSSPRGLEQLAGPLKTQEALLQGSPTQKGCPRIRQIFSRPSQACCSFSGLQGVLPRAGSPMQLIC